MTSDKGEYSDRRPDPCRPCDGFGADRPSREPRDDLDADLGPNPFREMSYLDRQFGQSSMVMLVLFPLVAGVVALAFALAGVVLCRDRRARRNAWVVLALSLAPAAGFVALVAFARR